MSALSLLHRSLLSLHSSYSPNTSNYYQLSQLKSLHSTLLHSKSRLSEIQHSNLLALQQKQKKIVEIQEEKRELYEINRRLVESSEGVRGWEEEREREWEEERERGREREKEMEGVIEKLKKEIGDLRLMHQQEMFIMKKKEKKDAK